MRRLILSRIAEVVEKGSLVMTALTQPRLLLISNELHFIYLIQRYGEESGWQVSHVPSVELALASSIVEQPAMLFLHLVPGAGDGWSALRPLQESPATSGIPITVISALADESRARAGGAAYWLWQPVLYNDFLSVVAEAM